MEILTKYPVYLDDTQIAGEEDWLAFDSTGKPTNKEEVIQFQRWLVSKGIDISYKNKQGKVISGEAAIDGDMRAGGATDRAWQTYGTQFATEKGLITGATATTQPTALQQFEEAKKGRRWDKVKGWVKDPNGAQAFLKTIQESGGIGNFLKSFGIGRGASTPPISTTPEVSVATPEAEKGKMSNTMKIALIGGGVVVVGLLIYAMTRKK